MDSEGRGPCQSANWETRRSVSWFKKTQQPLFRVFRVTVTYEKLKTRRGVPMKRVHLLQFGGSDNSRRSRSCYE